MGTFLAKNKCPMGKTNLKDYNILQAARFACLRCAAGGHCVSAGGALWAPVVTLINYKGNNISKYVCPTVIIDIARKITKFINFLKNLMSNDDVITK